MDKQMKLEHNDKFVFESQSNISPSPSLLLSFPTDPTGANLSNLIWKDLDQVETSIVISLARTKVSQVSLSWASEETKHT